MMQTEIKTIFSILKQKKINHFITISKSAFRKEYSAFVYTIFVLKKDMPKLNERYGFIQSERPELLEYAFKSKDLEYFNNFKQIEYRLALRNEYGKIFELKNKNFLKYYKKWTA